MPLFTNFLPAASRASSTGTRASSASSRSPPWRSTAPCTSRGGRPDPCGSAAWSSPAGRGRPCSSLWVAATAATAWVRPEALSGLASRPWAFAFVAMSAGGLWGIFRFPERGRELAAFLSSSAFLLGMVATALAGQLPVLAAVDARPCVQPHGLQPASGRYGMGVALTWWAIGIVLVAGYFTYLFRSMRGKVGVDSSAGY